MVRNNSAQTEVHSLSFTDLSTQNPEHGSVESLDELSESINHELQIVPHVDNKTPSVPRIRITLQGEAAQPYHEEAASRGVDVESLVYNAIGLGLKNSQLQRDGWSGPFYERPRTEPTRLTKFLGLIGINRPERIGLLIDQKSTEKD
ncbi:MAG TPA: hypothetical protein VLF39_03535 [Candidatus Saccharimonadales bacterium]|nr:hypothetical protein [Candidatus Saccharimonadales bacterium]